MKTPLLPRLWSCRLLLMAGVVLLTSPVFAKERFRFPPPPSPEKVVKNIRGFIHRVASGVKDASKQTWSAIRDPFINDEEDEDARSSRSSRKPKGDGESPDNSSFARAKEAVPYRYDDADTFDARTKSDPAGAQDDSQIKPSSTPGKLDAPSDANRPTGTLESTKPADPASRRPFMTPEQSPPPSSTTTQTSPETLPAAPKATPPGVNPNLEFARPVPGKRGLVYPPGAKESSENMVDVGDFKTGQIVRDPRTGKLFRVP